jgi:hypothetical protein
MFQLMHEVLESVERLQLPIGLSVEAMTHHIFTTGNRFAGKFAGYNRKRCGNLDS